MLLEAKNLTVYYGVVKALEGVSFQVADGEIVAVCVLVNRDPDNINSDTIGEPFYALAEIKVKAWDELECPLCKKGTPINTVVGKGREFLLKKKNSY